MTDQVIPVPSQQWRHLHLIGAVGAETRLETFRGAQHLVAPIVLLVGDAVIHPVNAPTPELVPSSVLAVAPSGWDGRPAMAGDHPQIDGAMVSANSPVVLERMSVGQLFNTAFRDNRLVSEVWLDLLRADRVEHARAIVARIRAGDPVEISVGAFVVAEARDGESNGHAYGSIWQDLVPDHVALLREGLTGACSVAMGCGTPRAAIHYLLDGSSLRVATETERSYTELIASGAGSCPECSGSGLAPESGMGDPAGQEPCVKCHGSGMVGATAHAVVFRDGDWCVLSANGARVISRHPTRASAVEWKRQRRMLASEENSVAQNTTAFGQALELLSAQLRSAETPANMSDEDRRALLSEGLQRVEREFRHVLSVTGVENGEVVYLIDPDPGGPAPLRPYMRTFSISAEGRPVFGDERTPVRPRTEWVPILARKFLADLRSQDGDAPWERKAMATLAALQEQATAPGECGCGHAHSGAHGGAGGRTMAEATHRNAERIQSLVSAEHTPWTEADRAYLEGLTDERLATIEANATSARETTEALAVARETAANRSAAAAPAAPKWDDLAPPEIKQIVADHKAAQDRKKRDLVQRLARAQTVVSAEQLALRDLRSLEELAAVAGLSANDGGVDYSVLTPATGDDAPAEPPKPYTLALERRKNLRSVA